MIFQTDKLLPSAMQKYGCAFSALAYYRQRYQGKPWTASELGAAWTKAIVLGIVSGDLNHDGDLDDAREAEIQDWKALVTHLDLRLEYLGKFPQGHPTASRPDSFVITSWTNPANGFVHWVIGDKRPVEFDPIFPGSQTVKNGILCQLDEKGRGGLRVFKKL
jgi:hypothetical protein